MRNAVVVSLAVLALAFVPVLAPANAPIFIDVPGMITIYNDGTFPDAFGTTLDAAVYDPDNDADTLTWRFQEPAGSGIITVNTVGPGVQLRTDATSTFDVMDTSVGTSGVVGITPADYAGTNAEDDVAAATGGTATATKITVQCTDDTHVTEKDILIVSHQGAGTNVANGISAVIAPYGAATDFSAWAAEPPLIVGTPPAMAFTQTATGLQIAGTVADNLDNDIFLISGFYGAIQIGPGVNQLLPGTAVDVQQGKMYRQTMTVTAANVAAGAMHDNLKFDIRAGTLNTATFDIQSQSINQGYRNLFPSSLGLKTPWWNNATHVATIDNIFCAPQEARFAGIGWGGADGRARNYRMFIDVHDIDSYFYEGDLTFSNCVLEELDRPDVGSNGYLAAWGAGAKAFDEDYKPQAAAVAQAANGDLGFAYDVQSYSRWSGEMDVIVTRHTDIATLQGQPPTAVTDLISTATFDSATNNQVGMFSSPSNFGIVTWQMGAPIGAVGGDFNAGSVIDYADELYAFSDLVYYRATITITGDPLPGNNPQLRIVFGNGYGQTAGALSISDGWSTTAGPDDQPTVYEVWFRGPNRDKADAGQQALNNLELDIQMMDGLTDTGDTWRISDVRVEAFPVDYFDN